VAFVTKDSSVQRVTSEEQRSPGDGLWRSPENGQHDTTAPGFSGDTDWQQGDAPQSAG